MALIQDEDVAKPNSKMRRFGKSLKQLVDGLLRLCLASQHGVSPHEPFKVKARPLGTFPGLNYDNIGELLEQAEGPFHR